MTEENSLSSQNNMDAREAASKSSGEKLLLKIATIASNTKAVDALALDVSEYFDLSDYFLILTGTSDRHVQGICNRILGELEEDGIKAESIEGYDAGHWALLDFGDVIVHVFYQSTRKEYDLDGLWSHAKRIALPDTLINEEKGGQRAA